MKALWILLIPGAIVLTACAGDSEPPIPTVGESESSNDDDLPPIVVNLEILTTPPSTVTPPPAITPSPAPDRSSLPNLGAAPELYNEVWLNTDEPLRLANLRGQVVLLEMWTFDCINCINILPSLRQWHEAYKDQGLVIIGNHYPEFSYERDLDNLRTAIARLDVRWAVAQDNDRQTWSAYNNRYWPTIYLIDKWGNIRYRHIGEGAYDRTNEAIKDLLAEEYTG